MSTLISDGTTDFRGGQDASKIPSSIPANAYYAGINVSTEKGILTPRWGFSKLPLTFPEGRISTGTSYSATYKNIFHGGKFQCIAPYTIGVEAYLVVVVSGIIFLINQNSYAATILDIIDGSHINEFADRINFASCGQFLVLFDYPAYPVIIDGLTARRADPDKFEVPISTQGTYNQNRLFIVNAGNEFTAGDATGNVATPEAPITFQEIELPASPFFGQIFQLPTNFLNEPITATTFLQVADTSTGIGPYLVGTKNAIYSFQTQQPRTLWTQGPFGSMFVYNAGIAGALSYVNINSDLFFMSNDGQVRSLSMSRHEQAQWSKTPISKEVSNWVKFWDKNLIEYCVMGYFLNKVFVAVNPYRTDAVSLEGNTVTDYAHGGMVVLELDNISTLKEEPQPAWAGLWTGVDPMGILANNEKFFIAAKDSGQNQLYEVTPGMTIDLADGVYRNVRSVVYTREYTFESIDPTTKMAIGGQFRDKEFHSLDLDLTNVEGNLTVNAKFRPSQTAGFIDWRTFTHTAPWQTCDMPVSCEVNGFAEHRFRELSLGAPVADYNLCDPVTKVNYRVFRKAQLKLTIEGKYWELQAIRLKANLRDQTEQNVACSTYDPVALCEPCDSDWYIPPFLSCKTNG